MTEYGWTSEQAESLPLAKAFVFLQCIHRRAGVQLAAPDSAEKDLIAELEAERKERKRKRPCRV